MACWVASRLSTSTRARAKPLQIGANELLTAKANPNLLPKDSQALWGPARLAEVYGVNLSPNYPYAGELISSMWQKQSGAAPNAVLALDQRATALLIEAVGGITVDGITLNGANAVQFLSVVVYEKFPTTAAKDAFVTDAMGQLIKMIATGSTSPIQLAGSSRMRFWSAVFFVGGRCRHPAIACTVTHRWSST